MIFVLLSLLPYVCLAGTVRLFWAADKTLFEAAVSGALVWSLALWAASNVLSVFTGLCRPSFIVFWLLYAGCLLAALSRRKPAPLPPWPGGLIPAAVAIICFCALLAALCYPPNMWDAHAYHLPRVMHWLQNHTLAPYPAAIPRQIGMPPFNSLLAMQSLGMGGGDRFVNLGQWLAFAGMICGCARIAVQLGGGARAGRLAALFIATLPNALIHASSAESSNIVAFWLLASASCFLDWKKTWRLEQLVKFGLCLGFAILSKGSAYAAGLPFVALVAWFCLRRPKKLLLQGVCAALCIALLNLPHYARVFSAYGTLVASSEKNIVQRPTPGTFAVNSVYNFLLHLPWLLGEPFRPLWQKAAAQAGVKEDDRAILPWGGLENAVARLDFGDASAPNPLHALLLLLLCVCAASGRFRPPGMYFYATIASFCAFFLLLTWHPWAARIQTVLFALAAPLAGLFMDGWRGNFWRGFWIWLFLLWTVLAFQGGMRRVGPFAGEGKNFLYTPRSRLYFNNNKRIEQPYIDMVNFLASQEPKSVGLKLCDDAFEYPLWALLAQKVKKMPRILHLTTGAETPQFIVEMEKGADMPLAFPRVLQRRGDGYIQVFPPRAAARSGQKGNRMKSMWGAAPHPAEGLRPTLLSIPVRRQAGYGHGPAGRHPVASDSPLPAAFATQNCRE